MNTTKNSQTSSQTSSQTVDSRFRGLRALGRGIALSSAVAVMGVGTLSAADASAAGVSHGVRYAGSATSEVAKPAPTDLAGVTGVTGNGSTQLTVRGGKVQRG